jgi:hypothetical protein
MRVRPYEVFDLSAPPSLLDTKVPVIRLKLRL